jgi:dihydrofolate reductase
MAKIILFIATSADGFIADQNGNVNWLPGPNTDELSNTKEDGGYSELLGKIDTIFMGETSYKQIITFGPWDWKDKNTYVFTTDKFLSKIDQSIVFFSGNVQKILNQAIVDGAKNIWLLGGANLVSQFDKAHLIDKCIITEVPIFLHKGISLELDLQNYGLVEKKISKSISFVQYIYQKK